MDLLTLQSYLFYNPEIIWMIIAAVLLVLEVTIFTGIGVFFGALGAASTGVLFLLGILKADVSLTAQIAWFFAFTVMWAAILWKPFRKGFAKRQMQSYDSYIGTSAIVVAQEMLSGQIGQIKWSGTVMRAMLAEDAGVATVAVGQQVWVRDLVDGILVVQPSPIEKLIISSKKTKE